MFLAIPEIIPVDKKADLKHLIIVIILIRNYIKNIKTNICTKSKQSAII